jgi:hypothetical protein
LVTGTADHAGTDDEVAISLAPRNVTVLNAARDDWERGRNDIYDLRLNNIQFVNDITQIRISKRGTDGWCLQGFVVYLNEATYYEQMSSHCRWIDGNDGYDPIYEVREARLPRNVGLPAAPNFIGRTSIEQAIEVAVGHAMSGRDIKWGHISGRPVEVEWRNGYLHVDLDLSYNLNNSRDPEVDVDYDLLIGCDSVPRVAAVNEVVDVDQSIFRLESIFINESGVIHQTAQMLEWMLQGTGYTCAEAVEGGGILLR